MTLTQAVNAYLTHIVALLAPATGESGYGMFIDNQEGRFSFDIEPIVSEKHLARSAADLTYIQNRIVSSGVPATLLDLRDNRLHVYNGSGWSSSVVNPDLHLKPGRTYYSPHTRKVFVVDTLRRVEQLLAR